MGISEPQVRGGEVAAGLGIVGIGLGQGRAQLQAFLERGFPRVGK
jgi:hypothetical protein